MPLGLCTNNHYGKVFCDIDKLNPLSFSEKEQNKIIKFLWEQKKSFAAKPKVWFDFAEPEHLYKLFGLLDDMRQEDRTDTDSTLAAFIDTLGYYVKMADLTDSQREILELKIGKNKNQKIADAIN